MQPDRWPLWLVPLFLTASAFGQAPPAYRFLPHPCTAELASASATCGSVSVPENYAAPTARRIDLNVIVFSALEALPERGAQFDLDGGPGFAVTDSAGFYAGEGVDYRRHRDVVLIDQRGTGASHALRCPAIEEYERTQPAAPMYPVELIEDCARELATSSDLTQYTTANSARDLDAVREALGYRRIDLNALSYGTTLALRYIADFGAHARSAVLTGTVPATRTPPRYHSAAGERGLRLLLGACAADAACAALYPDPFADLRRAAATIAPELRGPFFEKIRNQLYLASTARRVPLLLHRAAAGDLTWLTQPSSGGRPFADGLYLSITCAESLARFDIDAAIAETRGSLVGSYRLERQRDACAHWPVAPPDPALFELPLSAVPVLFLSGALDPVTPPEWTAEVAAKFANGRQVIVPQGGHVLEGLTGLDTCLDRKVLEFVAAGTAADLDTTCFAAMQAGPFAAP